MPLGGVNGLSPPRFTGWVLVPCDAPAFADPEFPDPGLIVPTECTLVLVGGVNGLNPPRFPPACVGEDGLLTLRLPALFVDCRFESVPGLGRCIVPCAAKRMSAIHATASRESVYMALVRWPVANAQSPAGMMPGAPAVVMRRPEEVFRTTVAHRGRGRGALRWPTL